MPYAQRDSHQLFYERWGSGEPLLLIQGMAGHHKIWTDVFLAALAGDFDAVAFDHRGIGASTDVPGPFSIVDLADDAVSVMDELGWSSAHVMGISMGGMVAQEVALHHPDRVRGLVLGCTYSGGPGTSLGAPGPTEMFVAMQTGNIDVAIRAAYLANLSATYAADETHFEPFKAASLAVRVPMETVMRQFQAAAGHDTYSRLPTLEAATLVVHGTADRMIEYGNGVNVANLIPGARLHSFDEVGHLFWWERTAETAELIIEHCRAQGSSGAG
jgi:3-oxoadipate enol-lactonase